MDYNAFVLEYVLIGLTSGALFHVSTWLMGYGVRLLGRAFEDSD